MHFSSLNLSPGSCKQSLHRNLKPSIVHSSCHLPYETFWVCVVKSAKPVSDAFATDRMECLIYLRVIGMNLPHTYIRCGGRSKLSW